MPTIRVQCRLDEKVWLRIDALNLTPRGRAGRRGGSQEARRGRDLVAVVMAGIEAIEAREAARDAEKAPGTPATPRTDLPDWLREPAGPVGGEHKQ